MPRPSLPADLRWALARERDRLAAPGTWWTGAERVALARAALTGSDRGTPLGQRAADAATRVATRPDTVSGTWIEALDDGGLGLEAYVELVGVVARSVAVGTVHAGIEAPPPVLPRPLGGGPSRILVLDAQRGRSWVPVLSLRGPLTTLTAGAAVSAVPAEVEAVDDLLAALYLHPDEVDDHDAFRGLHRSQIELVAARTARLEGATSMAALHTDHLLRACEAGGHDLDRRCIVDSTREPGLPWGRELLAFTDALVLADHHELPGARDDLIARAGTTATARAAGVAAAVRMATRLVLATGLAEASRGQASAWASSQRSASIAAMHPEPAAVIAWR